MMKPVTRRANRACPRPRNRGWVARCAAALLVLLASTAYLTRDLATVGSGEHQAHHHPGVATIGHSGATPGQPQAEHDHSRHCPFCFAPAFATAAGSDFVLAVPALGLVAAPPSLERPAARQPANPAAAARAPPGSSLT